MRALVRREEGLGTQVVMRIISYDNGYIYVTSNAMYYDDRSSIKKLDAFPYANCYDVYIAPDNKAWVSSSAGIYIQVLMNLLTNSVKYTKEGSFKLVIKLVKKENDTCIIDYSVSDTGIGIKPEEMDYMMPEMDGIATLEKIREDGYELYTIMVHALKSSARIIGASRLSEISAKMEEAGKNGDVVGLKPEGYLLKSINREELMADLQKFFAERK